MSQDENLIDEDAALDMDVGVREFNALMDRLRHVRDGRRFSRDEMNER